jgi:hypothetical protein
MKKYKTKKKYYNFSKHSKHRKNRTKKLRGGTKPTFRRSDSMISRASSRESRATVRKLGATARAEARKQANQRATAWKRDAPARAAAMAADKADEAKAVELLGFSASKLVDMLDKDAEVEKKREAQWSRLMYQVEHHHNRKPMIDARDDALKGVPYELPERYLEYFQEHYAGLIDAITYEYWPPHIQHRPPPPLRRLNSFIRPPREKCTGSRCSILGGA